MIYEELNINDEQEFCVLLLGHIGKEVDGARYLKNENDWTTLVEDILDIIHDVWPNITILIKPHIITDMLVLKNILSTRKHINIKIGWKGKGLKEVGFDKKKGNILVKIDPVYFRPTDINELRGDSSKAKRELKWRPKTSFKELVKEMMNSDLKKIK